MSRIGKRVLTIPENVNIENNNGVLNVKGPKGELSLNIIDGLNIKIEDKTLIVEKTKETSFVNAMHGTTNSNIQNMIIGVTDGYKIDMEIVGVGYRFMPKGKVLTINAGYSHPVDIDVPDGLTVIGVSPTEITITGIDKQAIGEFAAIVRKVRKPEPYKGKGIRYKDEKIRRKEGKKASK